MTFDQTISLLADARNILNRRQRGREARIQRLDAAGVPTDDAGLAVWFARQSRRAAALSGAWFKPDSVRAEHGGDADLPRFGKYAARILQARLTTYTVEPDENGDAWCWAADCGISGGLHPTETAARESGESYLRQGGWTRDPAEAEARAVELARDRHNAHRQRSRNYAAQHPEP